jgi:hypothetical protein
MHEDSRRLAMDSHLFSTRKTAVIAFVAAILIVGISRLTLSLAGVPDSMTTFLSISVVISVGMIYFGIVCTTWRDRLMAAYVLFVPYTLIAVTALSYTWITGVSTIFQRHEHSMTGLTVGWHTAVMFIGGFSFEPLLGFAFMSLIAGLAWIFRPRQESAR